MAKYIIDLLEDTQNIYITETTKDSVLATKDIDKSFLIPYTEPDREAIEDEVTEFWRIVGDMGVSTYEEVFGTENFWKVLNKMPYQEAKAKYEAWKREKDKICVGDEVEYECDGIVRFVVFGIVGNTAYGFKYPCDYDDVGEYCDIDMLTKTGRHFDYVEKLLEEIRGESHEHH